MNAFNNLKVGVKLTGGFLVVTAILVVVAVLGYTNMKTINDGMTTLYNDRLVPIQQLGYAEASLKQIRGDLYKLLSVAEQYDETKQSITANIATIDEQIKSYAASKLVKDEEDELARFHTAWAAYQKAVADILSQVKTNDTQTARQSLIDGAAYDSRTAVETSLENLVAINIQVAQDTKKQADDTFNRSTTLTLVTGIIGVVMAMGLGLVLTRVITNPLNEAVKFLGTIARGDISQDPSTALQQRKDELGDLAQSMLKTAQYLRLNVKDITSSAHTLSSSATELSAISEQTAASARESAMKANGVAAAAEEMSANTISVAAGMEQATTSLSSVATAVEEMTSTIGEIAKNSEKARYTTEQTAQQVNQYAAVMRELGQAAQEIGQFTETIASISAQTNLLALNATIEAARAGAAGKGFAVVANEIKELAQQTAASTGEIKNKITAIQGSAASAVQDVEKIVHIIQDVNASVSATAAAIQEQATVTQDIAVNIAQASNGIKDANSRVAQTATVSRSIAQDVASVSQAATELTEASGQTQTSAMDLSKIAERLNQLTAQFKV